MSHYFQTPTGQLRPRQVRATIWGREYTFASSNGVFSADRLDLGTGVLLRTCTPDPDSTADLLDLGCGFGPIAVALADQCPHARVTAVDVNDRALELTWRNATAYGVADRLRVCRPEQVDPDLRFAEIWSNPPIRIGKTALHELLTTWLGRLTPGGVARLVVGRNLGADSLHTWLAAQGWDVRRIASAKGFRVLEVHPTSRP